MYNADLNEAYQAFKKIKIKAYHKKKINACQYRINTEVRSEGHRVIIVHMPLNSNMDNIKQRLKCIF